MRHLQSAPVVLVWLGKERENGDLNEDNRPVAPPDELFRFIRRVDTTANISRDEFVAYESGYLTGLRVLFRRPCFTRTWILREVAVKCVCGRSSVPWETLARASYRLTQLDDLSSPARMLLIMLLSVFLGWSIVGVW
jgi:hypothetical protein